MKKRKTKRVMGLFGDFEEAFACVADIRQYKVPGVTVDDVTIKSPIEHPEIEQVLGERPSYVPYFTLSGGAFGFIFTFLGVAAAQASFLVQPQGGKAVITITSNLVLAYEMLILFGVLATLAGFIWGGGLMRRRSALYTAQVSLDQVGVVVDVDDYNVDMTKALFKAHKVTEIHEEDLR